MSKPISNLNSIKNVIEATNLADAFYKICETHPNLTAYSQAVAGENDANTNIVRKKRSATFNQIKSRVNKISAHLLELGLKPNSKVAIVSASRPEWMEADIAILSCSAVSVSVFQSLPADDIGYILYDSGAEIVFVENQEQLDKITFLKNNEINIPATEDRSASKIKLNIKAVIAFENVQKEDNIYQLEEICLKEDKGKPQQYQIATRETLAALVYTSGTTGPPKGVMQTHGNHLANVRQAYESEMLDQNTSLCLILPLAHSFAKLIGYLGFLTQAKLCFPAIIDKKASKIDPKSATKDIRESGATIFPVVPRLLEKMQDGVLAARNQPGLKGKLISTTIDTAKTVFDNHKNNKEISIKDKIIFTITKPLRKKIRKQLFGSNFSYGLSGGAKLPVPISEFFYSLEIPIIEGYGLTETCVATNVGRLGKTPIGTVGPVLSQDIELKIAEDSEILFRGPNIALGYYNRPTATSQSWDSEKWFHTGDLGSLDTEGNLSIVGRKKEIIVTSGGKNIAPHDIEVAIKSHPLISQAVLVGDGRKYCVAIVTLNAEQIVPWAKARKLNDLENINQNQELKSSIQQHLSNINKELANYETVKDFYIAAEDFTIDNGFLTPTFKIKRSLVEKKYKEEIERMY